MYVCGGKWAVGLLDVYFVLLFLCGLFVGEGTGVSRSGTVCWMSSFNASDVDPALHFPAPLIPLMMIALNCLLRASRAGLLLGVAPDL